MAAALYRCLNSKVQLDPRESNFSSLPYFRPWYVFVLSHKWHSLSLCLIIYFFRSWITSMISWNLYSWSSPIFAWDGGSLTWWKTKQWLMPWKGLVSDSSGLRVLSWRWQFSWASVLWTLVWKKAGYWAEDFPPLRKGSDDEPGCGMDLLIQHSSVPWIALRKVRGKEKKLALSRIRCIMPLVAFISHWKSQSLVWELETGQRIRRKGTNFGSDYEENHGPADVAIYYLLHSL